MKYGIEGYGLYFACIEMIAGNISPSNVTFELEHDAEILAYKFKVDTIKIEKIMKYCVEVGLFELNNTNGRIVCTKLAKRLDNTMIQNKEIKVTLSNFNSLKAEEKRSDKNRKEKKVKEKKKFTPPTLQLIKQYIIDNNLNDISDPFFKYYTESNWHDMYGKPVKNWKLKLITWSSREGSSREGNRKQEEKSDTQLMDEAKRSEEING